MPSYVCKQLGCSTLVSKGEPYCERHKSITQYADSVRDLKARQRKQFYNSAAWQRVRGRALAEDPICLRCGEELATEVHHLVSLSVAWELRLIRSNLEALCKRCHSRETAKDW